jgi:hypothetical protein
MKQTHLATPGRVVSASLQLEQLLAQEWVWVVLLFVVGLVSRVIFQSQILYHWDSVNFAYAIHEFDLAKEQPHPPGYIGYVWLSQVVDSFIHDAQTTLVSLSIVASALSVVALFYLGRAMFDRRVGLIAALFLASSPLFWFYGEIALPHTLDTLLVIVAAWWLYETMVGKHGYLYPGVVMLAIAGGVRPQTLVFLAPLLLFALRGVGWRRFLVAGLLGGVVCLGWFIPLMALSGGYSNYMRIMGEFGSRFQDTTSVFMGAGWWGLQRNLIKLTLYTGYGWSLPLLPAILYVAIRFWQREWPQRWDSILFLCLWAGPSLLFYVLVHMGQQGLVFVFLPAFLLVSAVGLVRLLAARPYWLTATTAALVALNIAIFWLGPEYPLGTSAQRLLTRETLVNSDRYYQARIRAIRENFAPEATLILAANWHHVEYYLPEYRRLPFNLGSKWEINEGAAANEPGSALTATPAELDLQLNSSGSATVVIFDPELMDFNSTPELAKALSLSNGEILNYLKLDAHDQLQLATDSFGVSLNH